VNTPHVQGKPSECPGCYEVFAPCPFCDRGRELEFNGMYGENGYWKGERPQPSDVKETCRCYERPLGKEASFQRLAQIQARLKEHLGDQDKMRRQKVADRLATPVMDLVTKPPAVKLDTMPSTNGHVDDDEIGTLL
jgi:hypothetical protein